MAPTLQAWSSCCFPTSLGNSFCSACHLELLLTLCMHCCFFRYAWVSAPGARDVDQLHIFTNATDGAPHCCRGHCLTNPHRWVVGGRGNAC